MTEYTAGSIPPEWHGWINYINDFPPTTYDYKKPVYAIAPPACSPTGSAQGSYYQPKGAWANAAGKRSWLKYEAWAPPGAKKA